MGLIVSVWLLVGAWDLLKSEFLPERYQGLTVVHMTPHLGWRTWTIILLVILIIVLFEGAHAAIAKRNKQLREVRTAAAVISPIEWRDEWKDMEDKFRKIESEFIFADCHPDESRWDIRTDKEGETLNECKALCGLAGARLAASYPPIELSGAVTAQGEDWKRWVCFVVEKHGYTDTFIEHSRRNGQNIAAEAGYIYNLPHASALVCIECAKTTYSKRPV